MAEPARNLPLREETEPDDEESETVFFQRWVERPDGRLELLEMPLTPEVFLDPQLEDKMTQGPKHSEATTDLASYLRDFLLSKRDDVLVLSDEAHAGNSRPSKSGAGCLGHLWHPRLPGSG